MHELSIAMSLIDTVGDEAAARKLTNIKRVHLRLGALSGVVKASLLGAYEIAREGSLLAGAELVVEDAPILIRCPACCSESTAQSLQSLRCSRCGTPAAEVISGRELELVALEVEQ